MEKENTEEIKEEIKTEQEKPEVLKGTVGETLFEKAMSENYLIYAWSTLLDRALPQIDGMLPVQRRIILTMNKENLTPKSKYKKCASIVGTCLASYHPHGDASVYGALARMSQEFSMRLPLVDGQGSFGSIDGDPPAAYRYTEARMTDAAEEMVADLHPDILPDYISRNFDESLLEPAILPTRFPNLLINGAYGIATGMTSFFLPHNPAEAIDLCSWRLKNPNAKIDAAIKKISGPDFPTGGVVIKDEGLESMYKTGKGRVTALAKAHIEKGEKGKSKIVITELPWMVQKGGDSGILKKLSVQYAEGKYPEFDSLNDYSTREIRVEIGLKRGANPGAVLEKVLNNTGLRKTYGVEMNCVVGGRPKTINLLEMVDLFLEFRRYVVIKRAEKRVNEIKARLHKLDAYMKVIGATDKVVAIIKKSKDRASSKPPLKKLLNIDDDQAQLIVEMQLGSLTQLDSYKIEEEVKELTAELKELEKFIKTPEIVTDAMIEEFNSIKQSFKKSGLTERKTAISEQSLSNRGEPIGEVLETAPSEPARLLISKQGRVALATGSGKRIGSLKLSDQDCIVATKDLGSNDEVAVFSSAGKAYRLRLAEIEPGSRRVSGEKMTSITGIQKGEEIIGVLPIHLTELEGRTETIDQKSDVVLLTKKGNIKRVSFQELSGIIAAGTQVIKLSDDQLSFADLNTNGDSGEIVIAANNGKVLRFSLGNVRVMGRAAGGVKGINLKGGEVVSASIATQSDDTVVLIHETGFAKKFPLKELNSKGRGGQGVSVGKTDGKYGNLSAVLITSGEEILIESEPGRVTEEPLSSISSGKVTSVSKPFKDTAVAVFKKQS